MARVVRFRRERFGERLACGFALALADQRQSLGVAQQA